MLPSSCQPDDGFAPRVDGTQTKRLAAAPKALPGRRSPSGKGKGKGRRRRRRDSGQKPQQRQLSACAGTYTGLRPATTSVIPTQSARGAPPALLPGTKGRLLGLPTRQLCPRPSGLCSQQEALPSLYAGYSTGACPQGKGTPRTETALGGQVGFGHKLDMPPPCPPPFSSASEQKASTGCSQP